MDVLDCCCWCAGVLYASATRSLQNEKNVFSFSRTENSENIMASDQTSKWRTAPYYVRRVYTIIVNITTLRTKTRTMEWRGTNGCLL